MKQFDSWLAALVLVGGLMSSAQAQVEVTDPWVRGTVAGQKSTGAFMTLKSATAARLVEVKSPAAAVVEVHEMVMDVDVMRMRAVPSLDLPAGKPVEFKPGAYHVMLIDLKAPLKAGDKVPLSLVIEGKDGARKTLELQVPVRALAAGAGTEMQKN